MKHEYDYKTYAGVRLGQETIVEDYCVLGITPGGKREGELETTIGPGAHL